MIVGYARVSSKDQNIDRQIDALRAFGLKDTDILTDVETGKTTDDRKGYRKLKSGIVSGDVSGVVVFRVSRLGRDHYELTAFFQLIEQYNCSIISLKEPFVEYWKDSAWAFKATWDVITEARYELMRLKERQAEGIAAAKARNKHLGRPRRQT